MVTGVPAVTVVTPLVAAPPGGAVVVDGTRPEVAEFLLDIFASGDADLRLTVRLSDSSLVLALLLRGERLPSGVVNSSSPSDVERGDGVLCLPTDLERFLEVDIHGFPDDAPMFSPGLLSHAANVLRPRPRLNPGGERARPPRGPAPVLLLPPGLSKAAQQRQ